MRPFALRSAARLAPVLAGVLALAGARPLQAQTQALCRSHDVPACAAYAAHLDAAHSGEPDSVWAILRFVASPDEAQTWGALRTGGEREAFVRRFWELRAAAYAEPPEVRFSEHLRRLEKARALYPRGRRPVCKRLHYDPGCMFPANFAGMAVAYPPGENAWVRSRKELRIDDRGLALLRHGEPDRRVECRGYPGGGEVWIWAARGGGEPRVLLFSTVGGVSDFQLVNSAQDLECDDVDAAEYVAVRGLDARGEADAIRRRLEVQREVDAAPSTETALPAYAAPLEGVSFDLLDYATTERGISELTIAVTAPAAALRLPENATNAYRLAVAFALYDSTGVVARLDTMRFVASATPIPSGGLLSGVYRLRVPVGAFRYALRVEREAAPVSVAADSGAGVGMVAQGELRLDTLLAARELRLSALGIGRTDAPPDWSRGEARIALNPTHVVPLGARRLELYYEAYGLAEGEPYETEITLEPTRRRLFGKPDRIAFRFREDGRPGGPAAGVAARRSLDLRSTPAGDYRLRVRIRRLADGAEATRETTVHVR